MANRLGLLRAVFRSNKIQYPPPDAVGAFLGGDADYADYGVMTVVFENDTSMTVTRAEAGLPQVADGNDGCHSINGFLGIDSNGGPKIKEVTFSEYRDAASLDSIFFGTANGRSKGPGQTLFAENPFGGNCTSVQLPSIAGNPANNKAPIAMPGTSLDANNVLQLDGSLSSDPEGDLLSYIAGRFPGWLCPG